MGEIRNLLILFLFLLLLAALVVCLHWIVGVAQFDFRRAYSQHCHLLCVACIYFMSKVCILLYCIVMYV